MTYKPVNHSDADQPQMAEPTKYIVRCCELRKRRSETRSAPVTGRQRLRVAVEN